jgi:hypothetical protein
VDSLQFLSSWTIRTIVLEEFVVLLSWDVDPTRQAYPKAFSDVLTKSITQGTVSIEPLVNGRHKALREVDDDVDPLGVSVGVTGGVEVDARTL